MIIRTEPPITFSPEFKPFPKPEIQRLDNNVDFISYNLGAQSVFKLELIFRAGSADIPNPTVATLVCNMLREGTIGKSSDEVNELLDYYGSFLDIKSGLDYSVITLYGRSEFANHLIPLLSEIIKEPAFKADALEKQKQLAIQNLQISQKKTSYWSSRLLRQNIFGESHAYSRIPAIEKIDDIQANSLAEYHKILLSSMDSILVSGSYDDVVFNSLVLQHFGDIVVNFKKDKVSGIDNKPVNIEKQLSQSTQASLALGCKSISIVNSDYPMHSLILKLLGGYFGSRLMKTLREDKGLTYGVHAYFMQLYHGDFLQISSDVKLEAIDESISVIKNEIDQLLINPIEESELDTVKNYMLGEYVNDSNTAFDFAGLYKKIIIQKLPIDYFDIFYQRITKATVDEVNLIKTQVINADSLSIVKVY